jgi:6-phosphogluconate dehydrogenase (decarboxylating)
MRKSFSLTHEANPQPIKTIDVKSLWTYKTATVDIWFLLDKGDIIDGGNTYFTDTDRRFTALSAKGIHFFGMGISGGKKRLWLVLCLAVIKKPMKGYALSLNP